MIRDHHSTYDHIATERCEQVLLTLLGDVGPWSERIYLAGGLPDRLSGHSGRVGMAQDLVASGAGIAAVMQAGRWATPREVARYARRLAAGRGAVAVAA